MKQHEKLLRLTLCAIFAAMLCVISPLAVSIGPVPFAMQIFGVMLCAVTLRWGYAQLSVLVYLLLGLFLPLFSGGNTGITALPGPTGGYIWSYLLMVPVIRALCGIAVGQKWMEYALAFLGCVLGIGVCYLCGTVQFCLVTGNPFAKALSVCVVPFILPDLVKALVAALLGVTLRGILVRIGLDKAAEKA